MKKILILSLSVLILGKLNAQNCGTIVTNEQLEFMEGFKNKNFARTNSIDVTIPIQFHFVVRDNGTGGLTNSEAETVLSNVNSYYANSNIEFVFENPPNIIEDTDNYDWDANEGAVASSNDVGGVINVYFFGSINNNGTPLCGYTRFPPSSDRVFVAYGCATGDGTTLEHELGHYFTLFHTHGTTNFGTTDELVDGSNCDSAGDRLCDTPADPNLSGQVSNCNYIGNATDANGQIFNPQVENIMSYAPDQCVDLFTQDQYNRIREGFENGRSYLNWTSDGFTATFSADLREVCKENEIEFTGTGFGVTEWQWEFEGGDPTTSTQQSPTVFYPEGGKFDVRLIVKNNIGETVVVERNNYITVLDPLLDSRSDTLNLSFDNNIDDLEILNPDFGVTFEMSDVDYDGNSSSGSLFINNFNYISEQPFDVDEANTGALNNNGVNKYKISFDYAYAYRPGPLQDQFIYDSLKVTFNTGCLNQDIILFDKGGVELSSVPNQASAFEPTGQNQWRTVDLEYQLSGEETSIFKFINTSYNGNNLYIDNLKIEPDLTVKEPDLFRIVDFVDGQLTIRWVDQAFNELSYILLKSVNEGPYQDIRLDRDVQIFQDTDIEEGNVYNYKLFAAGRNDYPSDTIGPITFDNTVTSLTSDFNPIENEIKVYPNPSRNYLNISTGVEIIKELELFNIQGRLIKSNNNINAAFSIVDMSELDAGIYFVKIKTENKLITRRIILE